MTERMLKTSFYKISQDKLQKVFTKTVKTEPTIITGYQWSWSMAFLVLRYAFTQNVIAGMTIRKVLTCKLDASAPNTSLPPQKDFWKKSNKRRFGKV